MKKTYSKPQTAIYKITYSQPIMTTSTVEIKGDYDERNMTDLSRRFDFFDDEEDDE